MSLAALGAAVIFGAVLLFVLAGFGAQWLADWARDRISGDQRTSDDN